VQKSASPQPGYWNYHKALLPILLNLPTFFLPLEIYTPCLFVLGCGLTLFRVAYIWPNVPPWEKSLESRYNWLLVAGITAIMVGYYTWFQIIARDVLYLDYHDWGVYLNIIDNTLNGKWFYSDEAGRSFLGIHFIPGVILLLSPYVWVFRSEAAFFLLNSLLIFSGGTFVYFFARRLKINSGAALVLAFAVLIYASLSNMIITIYYGFHDIYTFFPLLFLFCWLWQEKRFKLAVVIFLVSLTLKETVPVFWLGMGTVIFIVGQRRLGLFIFLFSLTYLLVIVKIIMPQMAFQEEYEYTNRFINLGSSMGTVLLSPLINPAAVLKALFRPCNFYFLTMLLLPLGLLSLCRPLLLLPGFIMLGAVCLQETDQLQNIGIHYQTEFVALNFFAAVLAYKELEQGKIFALHRWLLYGLTNQQCLNLPRTVLFGTLSLSLLCNYFFGFVPFGKNDVIKITNAPRSGPDIRRAIEQIIPPGVTITTVLHCRFASYFVLRNKVLFFDNKHVSPGEYVMLDLDDLLAINYTDAAKKFFLQNKDYQLILNKEVGFRQILIFKRGKRIDRPSPLKTMSPEEWEYSGVLQETNNSAFSLRYKKEVIAGKVRLNCALRLERKVGADINIKFVLTSKNSEEEYIQKIYGDGIFPADFASSGDIYCFIVEFETPPNNIEFININVNFRTPETTL
jgi:uncharacterized membrane protein